jgi:hypothetical protein
VRIQLIKLKSEAIVESANDQPAARPEVKLPLEDQVVGLFNEADRSAAELSNVKDISAVEDSTDAVDTGINMGDSDGFALVCGYIEKLMKIDDVVSQVSTKSTTRPSLLIISHFYVSDSPLGKPSMEYIECHSKGSSPVLFASQLFQSQILKLKTYFRR